MSDMGIVRTAEPHNRLTRICAEMIEALEASRENPGKDICSIVFLDDHDERTSGLMMHGYEDDAHAMAHLFIHLKAIFKSNGQEFMVMLDGEEAF